MLSFSKRSGYIKGLGFFCGIGLSALLFKFYFLPEIIKAEGEYKIESNEFRKLIHDQIHSIGSKEIKLDNK